MKGKKNKVKMIDSDDETNGKEKNIGKKKKKDMQNMWRERRNMTTYERKECLTRTELNKEEIMLKDREGLKWMRQVYKKREEANGKSIGKKTK